MKGRDYGMGAGSYYELTSAGPRAIWRCPICCREWIVLADSCYSPNTQHSHTGKLGVFVASYVGIEQRQAR